MFDRSRNKDRASVPTYNITYITITSQEKPTRMTGGRDPTPQKTLKGIESCEISKGEVRFDRLLKRQNIYLFTGNVFSKLGVSARVTATPNVPEKIVHQIIRLCRRTALEVTGFVTLFLAGARLVERVA